MTVVISGQKAFGKDHSVKDVYDYYKMKLNGRYTAGEILTALDRYTDIKNDIPAPSDIIQIIDPPPKPISTAEFIHAKEMHALEGFPSHGYYGHIIKDYEKQNAEDRGSRPMTREGVELLSNVMKMVERK